MKINDICGHIINENKTLLVICTIFYIPIENGDIRTHNWTFHGSTTNNGTRRIAFTNKVKDTGIVQKHAQQDCLGSGEV